MCFKKGETITERIVLDTMCNAPGFGDDCTNIPYEECCRPEFYENDFFCEKCGNWVSIATHVCSKNKEE